ncbi:MAG: choice-of-anchor J domain-containing protein [Candidatus Cloacimonetes bacterium]|nr:choice-of-anchor J domain-containing protein [Candidatus Cloacimonadota bacterium]
MKTRILFFLVIIGALTLLSGVDIVNETFPGTDLGVFTDYDLLGAQCWGTSTYGNPPNCAYMSGYSGGAQDNEDWLISPAMNFTAYTNETLSFDNAYNYTGLPLALLISTDWDGTSNPTTQGTWTDITNLAIWSGGSFAFVNSGSIDISGYDGTGVYIAFKYLSNPTDGSTAWELDNILVTGNDGTPPSVSVIQPNGGEIWQQNNSYSITWTTSNWVGDVKIDLYVNGSFSQTLIAATADDGFWDWDVGTTPVSANYTIRVSDTFGLVFDYSDASFEVILEVVIGQDLFFSEYIEGSSYNKAIEIYNPHTVAVDLGDYRIVGSQNGGG